MTTDAAARFTGLQRKANWIKSSISTEEHDQRILHSCRLKNSNPNSLQDGRLIAEPLMIIYL